MGLPFLPAVTDIAALCGIAYIRAMSTGMTLRVAGIADLEALMALYLHLSPSNAPVSHDGAEAIFLRFEAYSGSAILIAEVAGQVVATCTLIVIPNLTRGGTPYGLIENVVTHPDHRGRGYGTALLDAATERAWAQGCYKVMLLTGSTERATLAFYEGAGFAQSKTGYQKRREPFYSV